MPFDKTRVIYHGVPVAADAEPTPSRDFPVVGCPARFEKRKGLEILVKAMAAVIQYYPDAQLRLAGSGPTGYSSVIKDLVRSLGLERNVKIQGFCDTPIAFLRDLDVFAFASNSEGFGIVLIEAMSMRLPIVASDIYPINHIVQHGKSGMLVEPRNPQVFATAIVDLFSKPQLRQAMGEAGFQRCVEEFSLERSLSKVHDLYLELMVAKSGADDRASGIPPLSR